MSLAQDILKLAGYVPPPPRPTSPKWGMHTVRIPGVRKVRDKWHAIVVVGRHELFLGAHPTPHRAYLAVRLWRLWEAQDYDSIPRAPESVKHEVKRK